MLLEKAWAKVNGGYANIISGLPCEALEFLTGFGSLAYDTENLTDQDLYRKFLKFYTQSRLIIPYSLVSLKIIKNQN
jgi:hypothetical protein